MVIMPLEKKARRRSSQGQSARSTRREATNRKRGPYTGTMDGGKLKRALLKLGKNPIHVVCKAGLDGSGRHNHRKQTIQSTSDDVPNSYIGMFVTSLTISTGADVIWENNYPNSQAITRPLFLERAKEDISHINDIFPKYDRAEGCKKIFDNNFSNPISYDIKTTMIDGKMASILCGDSGAFCKYCFSTREQCSNVDYITETGTFYIEKSYEQAQETWEKLECGEMAYTDSARKGQVH